MTQPVFVEASILALFLPAGTLEWFELVDGRQTDDGIHLVL